MHFCLPKENYDVCIAFPKFDCSIIFLKVIHGNSEYILRNNAYTYIPGIFFIYLSLFKNEKYNFVGKENVAAK